MKRHLVHKEDQNYIIFELAGKSYKMRTGKEGEPETVIDKSFDRAWEAYEEISKTVKTKLKEGYKLYVPIPENLFVEKDDDGNPLKDGIVWGKADAYGHFADKTYVLVDLENKSDVIEKMDKGLEYVKAYQKSGRLYFGNDTDAFNLTFFELNTANEAEPLKEIAFFGEVLKRYPDLEDKVVNWLDFAIGLNRGIYTDSGYVFFDVAHSLLSHHSKYIDKYLDFLNTWDWNHETDEESEKLESLIDEDNLDDVCLKAMAARRTYLAGQHGAELEIEEYLEEASEEEIDRFFQFIFLGLIKDNKKLNDPKNAGHYHEAGQQADYYLQEILEVLGYECDRDRMIAAIANVNQENPITLTQLLDYDYEIPMSSEFCVQVGHKKTSKQDYDQSILFFSKAIEQDPNSSDAYLGRGYAYYCKNDMTNAELDWLKTVELFPESISANRNLVEIYSVFNPNYEKALAHINKTISLYQNPKSGDYILRGSVYHLLGETEKATEDYQQGLASKNLGDYMAYAELQIVHNQFDKAYEIISDKTVVKPQKNYVNTYVIALFLECVALIALKKDYAETKAMVEEQFEKTVYNKWNFQLIDQWLKTASLEESQKKAIQDLMDYILENRSTNY